MGGHSQHLPATPGTRPDHTTGLNAGPSLTSTRGPFMGGLPHPPGAAPPRVALWGRFLLPYMKQAGVLTVNVGVLVAKQRATGRAPGPSTHLCRLSAQNRARDCREGSGPHRRRHASRAPHSVDVGSASARSR
jgi:hypothetical protein